MRHHFQEALHLSRELSEETLWKQQRLLALLSPMYLEALQELCDFDLNLHHEELLLAEVQWRLDRSILTCQAHKERQPQRQEILRESLKELKLIFTAVLR
jgi:hypothetical protein